MMNHGESKSYQLLDPIKQQIILSGNVIFDENISSINLLKSYSSLLHSDPFDIIEECGSTTGSLH